VGMLSLANLDLKDAARSDRTAGAWAAWLVSPDSQAAAELTTLLTREAPGLLVIDSREYPAGIPTAASAASVVCFLDACSNQGEAFNLLNRLQEPQLRMPVVAILSREEPDLALRCLRAGARGCLVRPFEGEHLRPILSRIGHPGAGITGGKTGRVVCVAPAKGSCGATTLAANLAHRFSRGSFRRVLLADMDPVAGDLAFVLKLQSSYSFVDALAHAGQLDADLWRGLTVTHRSIDVLLSPEGPVDSTLDARDAACLLAYARSAYDLVLLDVAGGWDAFGLELARMSDQVIFVVTADVDANYAAKRALSHFVANQVPLSKLRLVVSRWRKDVGLGLSEIESALGLPVFHVLPSDPPAVEGALLEGRPVASGSTLGKSLAGMAARFFESETGAAPVSRPSQGLCTLFSGGT
jgi:pilus assembly protein CpaE